MAKSSIEWTQMTWNPTTGCNKISAGCKFCYALTMSKRLKAMGQKKYKNGFKLTVHTDSLNIPYTWKSPKTVFVNSMSDLFHKDIPLDYLKEVFRVMNENPQHTFQILTKRGEILEDYDKRNEINWTPNIWMGVSVEDDRVTDRIDHLRNTNAKIKFLSLEPLLGPLPDLNLQNIDWVIAGGESGFKARPVKKEWIIEIKDQCRKQKVPFFFKQWGRPEFNEDKNDPTINAKHAYHAKGGCLLEGRMYRELPKVKRISVKAA
ncbi:MAG: phage Gp37/Gp68 family protein [Ignavibacteria bacterium]|nr:phage Gp37/Gp68 family protein [Ignavibacteria bacterium]